MTRFSKEDRQAIVKAFAQSNGGEYHPRRFLAEVERVGAEHPAHGWFEWNQDAAALAYRLTQAREFARDLRVVFKVRVIEHGAVVVKSVEAPLVVSPAARRESGGGYVIFDARNISHATELRQQAADALEQWLSRYKLALTQAGVSEVGFRDAIAMLEAVKPALVAA